MSKKIKKGFTLVELAIVIAVIAILAVVSLTTYEAVVNKANESADESALYDYNTVLLYDDEPEYMQKAMENLAKENFSIANFESKSEKEIVWNAETRRFVLIDKDEILPNAYKYFKIYNEVPALDDQKYSIYLNNPDVVLDTVNVKVGFDCGTNSHIGTVNYTNTGNPQEVIIHTDNSNLNVNAPADTVHHYGTSSSLNIEAVSNSSYFEHGISSFANLAVGRLVVYTHEAINSIYVMANSAIIARVGEGKLPNITRASNVTSFTIQIINEVTEPVAQSTVNISGTTATATGTVPEEIIEDVESSTGTDKTSDQSRLESLYAFRIGTDVDDETKYFATLGEALAHTSSTYKAVYLIKNIEVDETIVVSSIAYTSTVTLYLQGFNITGRNCCPLSYGFTKSFTINGAGGALIGSASQDALRLTSNSNIALKITNVNTVGRLIYSGTSATAYIEIDGGTHTNFTCSGKMIITTPKNSATYFDMDVTDLLNPYRSAITFADGMWKVTRKTQKTSNPIYCSTDGTTYYPDIMTALEYDKHISLSLKLLKNHTENVTTTSTRALTIVNGASGKTLYTYNGSFSTKGTLTLQYGTFNFTSVSCTTLSASTSSTITINAGTITTLSCAASTANVTVNGGTFNGNSSYYPINTGKYAPTIVINGGTIKGTSSKNGSIHIYRDYASKVTINGGTFSRKCAFTTATSGAANKYTLTLQGGTYASQTVANTYINGGTITEGYHSVTNSDSKVSIVADE